MPLDFKLKSIFIFFVSIIFILNFSMLPLQKAEAADEIYCAESSGGLCVSNAEDCWLACSGKTSTCTLGWGANRNTEDLGWGWVDSCSNDLVARCQVAKCPVANVIIDPDTNDDCMVRWLSGTTVNAKGGKWDRSRSQCIECGSDNTGKVWGDSSQLHTSPSFVFKKKCGADTACDEKASGNSCTIGESCESQGWGIDCVAGQTCSVAGLCVVAACTNACVIGDFQCSGTQPQNCVDGGTGCGVWQDTASQTENTAALCKDGKDNDCSGLKDGDDANCTANCNFWSKKPIYKLGQGIEVYFNNVTCNGGDFNIKDSDGTSKRQSVSCLCTQGTPTFLSCNTGCAVKSDCGYGLYTILTTDKTGTWTAYLESTSKACSNGISFKVVECFENSDCPVAKPNCDASGTCVAGGGGGTPNCDQLSCGGAVTNATCMCGEQKVTANGSYCCAVDNFYGTLADCQAADPSCAGGGGGGPLCIPIGGPCISDIVCCDSFPGICVGGFCTAATVPVCDPKAWYFCNPLKGTVDDIFQAGETMIGYILGIIGSVALLLIIISGVMYMTSMGNEEKITTSKKILTGAVIGLAIALLSYSLLQLVISIL